MLDLHMTKSRLLVCSRTLLNGIGYYAFNWLDNITRLILVTVGDWSISFMTWYQLTCNYPSRRDVSRIKPVIHWRSSSLFCVIDLRVICMYQMYVLLTLSVQCDRVIARCFVHLKCPHLSHVSCVSAAVFQLSLYICFKNWSIYFVSQVTVPKFSCETVYKYVSFQCQITQCCSWPFCDTEEILVEFCLNLPRLMSIYYYQSFHTLSLFCLL